MLRAALLSFAAFLSGCGMILVEAIPIGAPAAPKPQDCAIRLEPLTPAEAGVGYTQVGALCVAALDGTPLGELVRSDAAREAMRPNACALGGELVVASGFCRYGGGTGGSASGVEFGVYRAR